MAQFLQKIPNAIKRGWKLILNGHEVENVSHLRLEHAKLGVALEYGSRQGGQYDGIAIREEGGGGAVIVPFFRQDDTLFIGFLIQERDNMHGVLTMPAGFVKPGESHFQAAIRETEEEIGHFPTGLIPLTMRGICANRAFFWTPGQNDGLHFYGLQFNRFQFDEIREGLGAYKLKEGLFTPEPGMEKIIGCVFLPWWYAPFQQDDFCAIGCALLKAHLEIEQSKLKKVYDPLIV